MPAGLDGNPNPLVTEARTMVLSAVADAVLRNERQRIIVGVDGQSGSGKSTFADELATIIRGRGIPAVRSTTDSFHQPRSHRMQQGPTSAQGFYDDSHQLDAIVDDLLRPFADGVNEVRVAAFDEPSDTVRNEVAEIITSGQTVLVFEGLFLQRPELEAWWDHTIFLDADERRARDWLDFLFADLPQASAAKADAIDERLQRARWPRYRTGWRRYIEKDEPTTKASIVIDNNDLARPVLNPAATSS